MNVTVKRIMLLSVALVGISLTCQMQAQYRTINAVELPSIAVKTNLLHDAIASFNLGAEFRLGHKLTLDIPVSYNPWTFSGNKKWKHLLAQPELRWWGCEAFNGHFFGLHGHFAYYNIGALDDSIFPEHMNQNRYQGWLAGAGLSYGYHWILGKRWSLEATLGVGYAHTSYDRYPCGKCGEKLGSDRKNYVGPTRAGISLIYMIK